MEILRQHLTGAGLQPVIGTGQPQALGHRQVRAGLRAEIDPVSPSVTVLNYPSIRILESQFDSTDAYFVSAVVVVDIYGTDPLQQRATNRHRQLKELVATIESSRGFRTAALAPDLREIVVVVPAHNERDRLPTCLASLTTAAAQVTVPVTVMVVLDGCTDRTESAITGSVQAISVSSRNVGAARAAGFVAAAPNPDAGIWLATTDADSVVPETWLANQVAHHRALMQGFVGTVSVDWQEHSAATRLRYERLYRVPHGLHGHVHGANLGVRADAYWRVGGFRPLRVGEDVDLVDRLLAAGTPLAWDADSPVLTSDRRDCRAQGGFGDYVRSVADDAGFSPASADIA